MTDQQPTPSTPAQGEEPSYDLVAGTLGGEKAVVIWLAHEPVYKVPGRREDGTDLRLGPAEAAEYRRSRSISRGDGGLLDLIFPSAQFHVRGPENAKAIPMAEALVDYISGLNGTPKFVYSDNYVAVIRAMGTKNKPRNAELRWWAGPGERVKVARDTKWRRFTITWDDGSTIVFNTLFFHRRGLRKAYG